MQLCPYCGGILEGIGATCGNCTEPANMSVADFRTSAETVIFKTRRHKKRASDQAQTDKSGLPDDKVTS